MLDIRDLEVTYKQIPVLQGINLSIKHGEIACLLGPSGCGKTTLLRSIAGLEPIEQGEVIVDGKSMTGVPVHTRDFGLMFQDFALFPHMNVAQNVAFGLKMQGTSHSHIKNRVSEILTLVGLAGFEERDVNQLSGGERQRVALARSLAPNPRLLMLDEPLGSLDAGLRERIVVELRSIIKNVGLTAIYVTHDQHEAFAIADRVAIMNDGCIEQIGTPETLYHQPRTAFVARFLGLSNILNILRFERNQAITDVGLFQLPSTSYDREPSHVLIHPDGLTFSEAKRDGSQLHGRITERVFQGGVYRFRVQVHETVFELSVQARNSIPGVGDRAYLNYDQESVIFLSSRPTRLT